MTFIDWSDSEGMCDLFLEYIREAMNDSLNDPERQQFLNRLRAGVNAASEAALPDAITTLKAIQYSIQEEFQDDPVFFHLKDLIHELERMS